MAWRISDQELANIEAQINANPAIVQALEANSQKPGGRLMYAQKAGDERFQKDVKDILRSYGIDVPSDYQVRRTDDGRVIVKEKNFFARNANWIVPAAFAAGAGIATAVSGPAAATTAGTTAGTTGTTAGTTAATTAGSKFWKSVFGKDLLPVAVGAGLDIYGNKVAADATKAATDAQAKANADALAFLKERDARDYRDLAPYRQASAGSLAKLNELMGLPAYKPETIPTGVIGAPQPYMSLPTSGTVPVGNNQGPPVVNQAGDRVFVPQNPTAQSGGTLASLGGPAGGQMVKVRAPDGRSIVDVPQHEVQQALAAGGQLVGA